MSRFVRVLDNLIDIKRVDVFYLQKVTCLNDHYYIGAKIKNSYDFVRIYETKNKEDAEKKFEIIKQDLNHQLRDILVL